MVQGLAVGILLLPFLFGGVAVINSWQVPYASGIGLLVVYYIVAFVAHDNLISKRAKAVWAAYPIMPFVFIGLTFIWATVQHDKGLPLALSVGPATAPTFGKFMGHVLLDFPVVLLGHLLLDRVYKFYSDFAWLFAGRVAPPPKKPRRRWFSRQAPEAAAPQPVALHSADDEKFWFDADRFKR